MTLLIRIIFPVLALLLLSCTKNNDGPTTISGTAKTHQGTLLKNQGISIEGIKEIVCLMPGCDDQEVVDRHQTSTNDEGSFYIEIAPNSEVEYYDVRISGTISGSNNCVTYSEIVYPGKEVTNLQLTIICE